MTTPKTETPRTDKFASVIRGLGTGYYQALEEMKKLETELAEANAKLLASQAREVRLREALEIILPIADGLDTKHQFSVSRDNARKALSAPASSVVPWSVVKEYLDAPQHTFSSNPKEGAENTRKFLAACKKLRSYAPKDAQ